MRTLLFLLLFSFTPTCSRADDDRCQGRSCYPVTGNLLIGRESQLHATSTCGQAQRQRYCIVSHLEEPTKCFYCDSRHEWRPSQEPYKNSHRVENVVSNHIEDKHRNWWQSENGVQNVTVQLDLEAEFHFTHLIMTFKSFRPAAMVIERSADYGQTWKVYRYFAYDCPSTFPGIPEGLPKKHDDVICTRQYSDVAPSTGGELVYKVISPHIKTVDPYSADITNLLTITNLRFNFTRLHTLGDDLLDYRPEIDEKYYYAVYEIVVRGSCSCYGHASECVPIDSSKQVQHNRQDIVHGRCACNHHTTGLNCEKCQDFFNDRPWRPAYGNETNECKRCECNQHAARCHFDRAVYEASGNVSGGVCDDCQHNTQGVHCEQCRPQFYRRADRPAWAHDVCAPCACDRTGSLNDGICEGEQDEERGLVAGKCYCKPNVDGARCDRCKHGYWNLSAENPDGCTACSCHLLGTHNNEGCDKRTGMCTCKRRVTGENCDQCLPEHYGLSESPEGCTPCDCSIGGAYDNSCDVTSGQCRCRPYFTGQKCDQPDSAYFCPNVDFFTYEAEHANITNGIPDWREPPKQEHERTWTGQGLVRLREGADVTFRIDNIAVSMPYNVVLRYEMPREDVGWQELNVAVIRPSEPSADGKCAGSSAAGDLLQTQLYPGGRYIELRPSVCLEAGIPYDVRVSVGAKRIGQPDRSAELLLDSLVLAPPTDQFNDVFTGSAAAENRRQEYERYQCRNAALALYPKSQLPEVCARYVCPVAAIMMNRSIECECNPTGSVSGICSASGGQCDCKPNVVGRRCDQCALGTYGFGPNGCTACDCDSVGSLHNRCDADSGQCECREKGIYGRQCNQCQPGFWAFPDCRTCQCNDHANACEQRTGACIECRDLTTGPNCERCQPGYYGDPRVGVSLACRPCPCPGGPSSGFQHADTCYLRPSDRAEHEVQCNCRPGYTGDRCAQCAPNHWGEPSEPGGTCEPCTCNGNIDPAVPGSCDATTGQCIKCLHHTEGDECERCVEGYFGDASQRTCQRCVCNPLGTAPDKLNSCDRTSGQCACLPNVIGQQCDQCADLYYDLASQKGCAACDCDPNGVISVRTDPNTADELPQLQCNRLDGQCHCKPGRGGRDCSECQDLHWGDPAGGECKPCECNPHGAESAQCDRETGACMCRSGSGGRLCNECARGYTGVWPDCRACGDCFHQWDAKLQDLKEEVDRLIHTAANIEDAGAVSVFDDQFNAMEVILQDTRLSLERANVTADDVKLLETKINELRGKIDAARERIDGVDVAIVDAVNNVEVAQQELASLGEKVARVTDMSQQLQEKALELKQADVEGAYNMTVESAAKSVAALQRVDQALAGSAEAEKLRQQVEDMLEKNRGDVEKQYAENEDALISLDQRLSSLESQLPDLNKAVCGAAAAPCDALCGGPSGQCSRCGGRSCMEGAVSRADQALAFVTEADEKLNDKQIEADDVLQKVRESLHSSAETKREADEALHAAKEAARKANDTRVALENRLGEIRDFIATKRATPAEIRALAEEVQAMQISLTPEQIEELAKKIRAALSGLTDIDRILADTAANKSAALDLEAKALEAAQAADAIRNLSSDVRAALKLASEAQESARNAITEARKQVEDARADVTAAEEKTKSVETKLNEANATLTTLEQNVTNVRVAYLQTTENSQHAYNASDLAHNHAAQTTRYADQLKTDLTIVDELVAQREQLGQEARQQADGLRQRATKLLAKTAEHVREMENLSAGSAGADLRLADYQREAEELAARLERVAADIARRTEYYQTCDV